MVEITLARALASRSESELLDLHDRWVGGSPPAKRPELVNALRSRMTDPVAVAETCGSLYGDLAPVFRVLAEKPGNGLRLSEVRRAASGNGVQDRSVRSALSDLVSTGLVAQLATGINGSSVELWGVPEELGEVLQQVATGGDEPVSMLTLSGWLARWFERRQPGGDHGPQVRRMYKLLAGESAVLGRIEGLKDKFRGAFHRIAVEAGGILPMARFEEFAPGVSPRAFQEALEEASLGTLTELDLETSGIRQRGRVAVLFHETVLAYLRRHAASGPQQYQHVASIGVDFVSNFSRFASFVEGDTVRFTVRGTIFKSTGKRIADQLLPNPGREFRRLEILELEYRFALAHRMIDRTGKRSFRLTERGQDFLRQTRVEKQRQMLDWLIEDRDLPGDLAHQLRLRRTALRYIKRLEPGLWYDAMFLPFVARNHHLATLSAGLTRREDGSFPVRSSANLQSLSWNLFVWVRKYLYLLGIIDMAYDDSGRAVAMRLTQMGAELLDVLPGRELEGAGHVVVNPDFEVVLFPDKRSHELVYRLDRFCEREFTDSLYHYRITPGSLHRALAEGMELDEVRALLEARSRTPLPQNVIYSLESWARKDGMVTVGADGVLECDHAEILDRVSLHPGMQALGLERVAPRRLAMLGPWDTDELRRWLRDFGVAVRFEAS